MGILTQTKRRIIDRPNPRGMERLAPLVLSFDVEEHFRIEAASRLTFDVPQKRAHRDRLDSVLRWLLDLLARLETRATFYIVGQLARDNRALVAAIHRGGHEIGSHGWDHRRILAMTSDEFREDLRQSCGVLEDIIGEAVAGYRAPTFSLVRRTAWAIDILAEQGLLYDSSIYPVRHDRYGVAGAPREPFLAHGLDRDILELPPATLRLGRLRIPAGGGGYFRLLPLAVVEHALEQTRRECSPSVAMLYFHPWEFDPDQPRLPLHRLDRFRTYVGIDRNRGRLETLLSRHRFSRAIDVVRALEPDHLERVSIASC